jgi:hypothetical protein
LQALQADRLQIARHVGLQLAWRDWLALAHLRQRIENRGAAERRPAGQHFVEDGAQRVHVGEGTDRRPVAAGLLRGHVTGGAEDGPRVRVPRFLIETLGQSEVGNFGRAFGAE